MNIEEWPPTTCCSGWGNEWAHRDTGETGVGKDDWELTFGNVCVLLEILQRIEIDACVET